METSIYIPELELPMYEYYFNIMLSKLTKYMLQLALKHRQGKNHKMRIVVFVGSPVASEEKELVKLAKKLKKEKVNVDIISFGEDTINSEVLTSFVNTLNGKVSSQAFPPCPQ